jgi:hypothetical protein
MTQPTIDILRGRGMTPEECAAAAATKLIDVSGPPEAMAQMRDYRDRVQKKLVAHMRQAAHGDRMKVYNALLEAGEPKLAELIMRL